MLKAEHEVALDVFYTTQFTLKNFEPGKVEKDVSFEDSFMRMGLKVPRSVMIRVTWQPR